MEKKYIEDYLTKNNVENKIGCFLSGRSFIECLSQEPDYDLVLLDVMMPVDNGIDVARQIMDINPKTRIAFVSAYADYATLGYRVRAIRFIIKNSSLEAYICECLEYVLGEMESDNKEIAFDFTIGTKEIRVDSILYIDAVGNYVQFVLNDMSDKSIYRVRDSLKNITDRLSSYGFAAATFRRSVNLRHVEDVINYEAVMDNGDRIKIAERKYGDFKSAFKLLRR